MRLRSKFALILLAGAPIALVANPARVNAQPLTVTSGVAMHFDAADSSTIFDSAGVNPGGAGFNAETVSEWKDKSSNANHMNSDGSDPSYVRGGMPAVRFVDRNTLRSGTTGLPTTEARTFFFVGTQTDNTGGSNTEEWYFSYGDAGPLTWMAFRTDDESGGFQDPTPTPVAGNDIYRNIVTTGGNESLKGGDVYDVTSPPGAKIIIEYSFDGESTGGAFRQYINGDLDHEIFQDGGLNTSTSHPSALGIGVQAAGSEANWDHNELILYDRALPEAERNAVGNYLSQKWGISSMYPGGGFVLGDFNGDMDVDLDDYDILAGNMQGHLDGLAASHADGDINGDSRVDLDDFLDFREIFEQQPPPGASASIPEPSSLGLLLCALAGIATLALDRSHPVR